MLPHSLFDPAYPLPALIANNYGEMMSIPLYDSALLLAALLLLVVVLAFNLAAQSCVLVEARKEGGLSDAAPAGGADLQSARWSWRSVLVAAAAWWRIARGHRRQAAAAGAEPGDAHAGPQGGYYLGKEGGMLNAIVGSLSWPSARRSWPPSCAPPGRAVPAARLRRPHAARGGRPHLHSTCSGASPPSSTAPSAS